MIATGALKVITGRDIAEGFMSLVPPITETEHIVQVGMLDGSPTYAIDTKGEVKLAKISFKMTDEQFDKNWFKLEPDTASETLKERNSNTRTKR